MPIKRYSFEEMQRIDRAAQTWNAYEIEILEAQWARFDEVAARNYHDAHNPLRLRFWRRLWRSLWKSA